MSFAKLFVLAVLAVSVSARYVHQEHPYYLIEEANVLEDDLEDALTQPGFEAPRHVRLARQIGSMNTKPDGSVNLNAKLPLAGNDKNILSGVFSGSDLTNNGGYGAAGAGLALDNVNGHGLSLTGTHIPKFGDQLTTAGHVALVNTPDHKLNANAFVTRNMPNIPNVPDFNTHGAGVNYMFKDKIGGSLGVAQTPLFQKTDYSAMGNLNLFRDRTSSLDLNAGFSKSVSPFMPKSSWQPSGGLSFTKYW
ncbi:attacin-like [Pectinophora gossypiella]|uniref:attacin-like n=1 Tax=Pectinophora gossypiella TaxID=13191 RepID=UPI00214F50F9|nr:attacin-like [Pectinophora gossypiella]